MAMSMRRAFNARMLTLIPIYVLEAPGYFNAVNDFIPANYISKNVMGVIITGNKFSQFEEGVSFKPHEGGERYSDYRTLYVRLEDIIEVGDYVGYEGGFYNVIQMSPEDTFGFRVFLIEKDDDWEYIEP